MKHNVLNSINSKSISPDTGKKKGLQIGYSRLKGKIKYPVKRPVNLMLSILDECICFQVQ